MKNGTNTTKSTKDVNLLILIKNSVLNFILRPYELSFIKEMCANTTKGTDDDLGPF